MRVKSIESLVRPNIARLTPYSTARDEYKGALGVFLDANESPYENGFNRYPDPCQKQLKVRLSQIKSMPAENIFLGNGSDEAIDLIFRVFCEPRIDNVVTIAPSYGMYTVAASINDVELCEVQLKEDYALPVDDILLAIDEHTKAIFICSPNNPTANSFAREDILRLVVEAECMVVIDEAYIDFAEADSFMRDIIAYPNIIVLQTLSKAWAMAGLRLGMAMANSRVVELMSQVKYPYNINTAAIQTASKLLELPVNEQVAQIKSQRKLVTEALQQFSCVKHVYPSDANFLLVKVCDADALYEWLVADGIIVRNRSRIKGCESCLRITIGLEEENQKLLSSISRYEKESIVR